jgi:hypothetical protein
MLTGGVAATMDDELDIDEYIDLADRIEQAEWVFQQEHSPLGWTLRVHKRGGSPTDADVFTIMEQTQLESLRKAWQRIEEHLSDVVQRPGE